MVSFALTLVYATIVLYLLSLVLSSLVLYPKSTPTYKEFLSDRVGRRYVGGLLMLSCCLVLPYITFLPLLTKGIIMSERTPALIAMYMHGRYSEYGLLHPFYEVPFPFYDFLVYATSLITGLASTGIESLTLHLIFLSTLMATLLILTYLAAKISILEIKFSAPCWIPSLLMVVVGFTPTLSILASSGPRFLSMMLTLVLAYLLMRSDRGNLNNARALCMPVVFVSIFTHPFGTFTIPLMLIATYIVLKIVNRQVRSSFIKDKTMTYLKDHILVALILCATRLVIASTLQDTRAILNDIMEFLEEILCKPNEVLSAEVRARIYEYRVNPMAALSWSTLPAFALSYISLILLHFTLKKLKLWQIHEYIHDRTGKEFVTASLAITGFATLIIGFINVKTTGTFYVVTYSAYALLIPAAANMVAILSNKRITRLFICFVVMLHILCALYDPGINILVRDQIDPEYTVPSLADYVTAMYLLKSTAWSSFKYKIVYGPLPLDTCSTIYNIELPKSLIPLWKVRDMPTEESLQCLKSTKIILISIKEKLSEHLNNAELVYMSSKYVVEVS